MNKKIVLAATVTTMMFTLFTGFHTEKSFTFNVTTGDQVTVELDTSDKYNISSDIPFEITCDGEEVSQGLFAQLVAYDQYKEDVEQSGEAEILDEGTKDGNDYYFWTYKHPDSELTEYNYVIKVEQSNTVVLLSNCISEESAKECFEHLTFIRESDPVTVTETEIITEKGMDSAETETLTVNDQMITVNIPEGYEVQILDDEEGEESKRLSLMKQDGDHYTFTDVTVYEDIWYENATEYLDFEKEVYESLEYEDMKFSDISEIKTDLGTAYSMLAEYKEEDGTVDSFAHAIIYNEQYALTLEMSNYDSAVITQEEMENILSGIK